MEWQLRTSVGAYDKVGKKDARWDDLARKAVDLAVRQASNLVPRSPVPRSTGRRRLPSTRAATIPWWPTSTPEPQTCTTALGTENLIRLWRDATQAYAASRYPAFRRAGSLESFASWLMDVRPPDDAARKEIEATLDASLALLAGGS